MNRDSVVKRSLRVDVRRAGESVYLRAHGVVIQVDGVGLDIWRRADGVRTVRGIADVIKDEFDDGTADLGTVDDDVMAFVSELAQLGFVDVRLP